MTASQSLPPEGSANRHNRRIKLADLYVTLRDAQSRSFTLEKKPLWSCFTGLGGPNQFKKLYRGDNRAAEC